MLRNALFSLLILIVGKSYAQESYFVLIQADNNQPFYVRVGNKSLSSNIKGRLILSQLKGGNYSIIVGFPKQSFPEQQFSFNIGQKDLEFQLKDLGEKGWGLFNPQTLELKAAEKKEDGPGSGHIEGVKKDDAFSQLMAGVVSDTAVMYNTYAMEEILKDSPRIKSPEIRVDTAVVQTAQVPAPPVKSDTALATVSIVNKTDSMSVARVDTTNTQVKPNDAAPLHTGTVVKLSERKTTKGLRLAFADRPTGRKADTIILIIPMDSSLTKTRPGDVARKKPDSLQSDASSRGVVAREKPDSSRSDVPSPGVVTRKKADSLQADVPTKGSVTRKKPDSTRSASTLFRAKPDSVQKNAGGKPVIVNSDCRNFASDYDVDKLRVKMLEADKDEDRIQTAKKIFKTKCFTTKQIRSLSEVFTLDAGKYRFFETAYPFVSDDRFRDLTDLLADPVYNSKFRVMTGQQ